MRWLRSLGLLGSLAVSEVAAQERPTLESRLEPQTLAELRPILATARADSVPLRALEDKALEGAAKRVPSPRIVAAVRQLGAELRDARRLLRDAAVDVVLTDGEIGAAADARRRGVPATAIAALRRNALPSASLLVPLTVLGDLVQRGVPAEEAEAAVEQLLAAGVPPEQIAEIPARVDVALRVGAPPLDALRSALPAPLRPVPSRPSSGPPRTPSDRPPSPPF
jgi:hypothetical protein